MGQNGMEYEIMQERNKHDKKHGTKQRTQNGTLETERKGIHYSNSVPDSNNSNS